MNPAVETEYEGAFSPTIVERSAFLMISYCPGPGNNWAIFSVRPDSENLTPLIGGRLILFVYLSFITVAPGTILFMAISSLSRILLVLLNLKALSPSSELAPLKSGES